MPLISKLLLFFVFLNPAYAEVPSKKVSCTNKINLKTPLSLSAPRDQGMKNWCFAFATADLVADATGILYSPAQMGLNSTDYIRNPGDGFVGRFVAAIKKQGACLEKDVKSDDLSFSQKNKDQSFDEIQMEYLKLIAKMQDNKSSDADQKKAGLVYLCDNSKIQDSLADFFHNINPEKLIESLINFHQKESKDPFQYLVNLNCKKVMNPKMAKLNPKYINYPGRDFSLFDKVIDSGKILAIEYDAGMLKDYTTPKDVVNGHASTIVGRRWNEKKGMCEYLLRNSWGKDCSGYDANYECVDGHVWIGEKFWKESDSIRRAIYLE